MVVLAMISNLITNLDASTTARDIEIKDAAGIDTIDFSDWIGTSGINFNLGSDTNQPLLQGNERTFTIDAGATIENIIGTPNDDTITGNSADNRIEGRAGTDTLLGAGGNDILLGEEGIDHLYGGLDVDNAGGGSDSLEGGVGDDHYYIVEETEISTVSIFDTSGNDTLDVQDASLTDTDTNARIIALDDRIDQTLGNVTILAGSLGEIENLDGRQLPTWTPPSGFTDDGIAPLIDLSSWNGTATELLAWSHTLSITNSGSLPVDDEVFYRLGEDSPAGMIINEETGLINWTPRAGQEGDHTFTVYATRYGTAILRSSEQVTLTVANSTASPEITTNSLKLSNPHTNATTTIDAAIEGEITYHDSLDGVEVRLTFVDEGDATKTFTVSVAVNVDGEDPYRGTFDYKPSRAQLKNLLGADSVTLLPGQEASFDQLSESIVFAVSAVPVTIAPLFGGADNVVIHDSESQSLSGITLSKNQSPAYVEVLELANDTGISNSDLVTIDPVLSGKVSNDGPVDDLLVSFRLITDNVDMVIGTTRTDENGDFIFEPERFYVDSQVAFEVDVTIEATVQERGPLDSLSEPSVSDPTSLDFKIVKQAAPEIDFDDYNPVNPVLSGSLSWVNQNDPESETYDDAHPREGITIQFSRDNFDTIEGNVITDSEGKFEYLPVGLEHGVATAFSVRALSWGNYKDQLIYNTTPVTVNVTRDTTLNSTPEVGSLTLKYDQSSSGQVVDPTITGTATKDSNAQAGIYVEYSIGDDTFSEIDGFAITDENGVFEFTPVELELDTQTTIYVRAAEWDGNRPENDRWLHGATQSIPVTLVAPTAPTVTNLKLVRETGGANVSSDATIRGEITAYFGDPSAVTIEFEVNGVIAGEVTPEEDGSFEFLAEGYHDAWNGSEVDSEIINEVRVRALIPNFGEAPDFEQGLLGDENGTPTAGWYADDYFNSNSSGEWSSDLIDQWLNETLPNEGVHLGGEWHGSSFTRDWDGQAENIEGDWAVYSFTLNSLSVIVGASATAISSTTATNPTLTGVLTDTTSPLAGRTLEFTYDGKSQGTTVTDEDGNYSFTPDRFTQSNNVVIELVDLKYGSDTPNRTVVYDGTISVSTDATLLVSSLKLANPLTLADGGSPASSIDPTVTGTISKPGDVSLQIVEFDYDGDNIADGSTLTDAQGNFEYEPTGIATGLSDGASLSIRSRVVNIIVDEANNTSYRTIGDWSAPLDWTYVAQDAPEFEYFQLEQDTGHYGDYEVLDGITSNPNLVGRVVANGLPVAYQSVEFDHDGDGVIDGYTSTDAEGRFRYEPQGLERPFIDGSTTQREAVYFNIQAQVVIEDINKDENLTSEWTSVTRTGRTDDVSHGVGFTLVDADALVADDLSWDSSRVHDPTITGSVHWNVPGSPAAENSVVVFYDVTDSTNGVYLGVTQTDQNGNFEFLPVGIIGDSNGRLIEARPIQEGTTSISNQVAVDYK